MTERNGSGGAGFLAGLVIGAIAGAAIGLLLAPRAGEETREALMERGIELRGRLLEGDAGQVTAEISSRPANALEEFIEQVRDYLRSVAQSARETWERALREGRVEAQRTEQSMLREYQSQLQGPRLP